MVIIDAEIYMYRLGSLKRECYVGGFMASIQIGGIPHMCMLSEQGKPSIPLEQDIEIKISILTGEWNLKNIKVGESFKIFIGDTVLGKGFIKDIPEIYVEKYSIELEKDSSTFKEDLKEVIDIASSLDNAMIEEGVVEMLDE